jgi:hypothetical protein
MLSDVTLNVAGHMVTVPGIFLLTGTLVLLALFGFLAAIVGGRRARSRASDAAELLAVQLERIGDALDRLVRQNASREATLQQQGAAMAAEPSVPAWAIPRRTTPASAPSKESVSSSMSYEQFPSESSTKFDAGVERAAVRETTDDDSGPEPFAKRGSRKPPPSIPYSIFGR